MDQKKMWLLPGVLIILVILSAGCTSSQPAGNTTSPPTVSPVVVTTTPTPSPVTENITPPPQPSATTVTATPVPEPIATLTTKPIPSPTMSSIYVYGVGTQIFPLSFDDQGVITKGNITISGVIQSLSSYPLQVVMRGEIIGAYPPSLPRATAYETVTITPHGISGFMLEMDDYVFNYRPDYAVTHESFNLTVMNVSVAPL